MESLEARLRGRGTETEEKIAVRLKNAKKELEYGLTEGNVDAVVVNDSVENAFVRLLSFLEEFYSSYGFHVKAEDLPNNDQKEDGKNDEEEEEDDA